MVIAALRCVLLGCQRTMVGGPIAAQYRLQASLGALATLWLGSPATRYISVRLQTRGACLLDISPINAAH